MKIKIIFSIIIVLILSSASFGENRVYSLKPNLTFWDQKKRKMAGSLKIGEWVKIKKKNGKWLKIESANGIKGFIKKGEVSDLWIRVHKKERKLYLMEDRYVVKTYLVALGFSPVKNKTKIYDGRTPEGIFYLCEMIKKPLKAKYGARSMRISYPSVSDSRRGLQKRLINKKDYIKTVKAIHKGKMPPQNTKLGGSIRIHGGGAAQDWTLGCVAMEDKDIKELYSKIPVKNCKVEIYRDKNHEDIVKSEIIGNKIYEGAKNLLKNGCRYTIKATKLIRIDFPMGDIDKSIGVCSDVAIRALRHAGIDLQAEIFEDILLNRRVYPWIKRADTNIDHRRTKNIHVWLKRNSLKISDKDFRPGDIVIFDTGVRNGTVYDHIGIVSKKRQYGNPLVINLWTTGSVIEEMGLIGYKYPEVVGHFRIVR